MTKNQSPELEDRLKNAVRDLEIPQEVMGKFLPYLEILHQKDIPTWKHSIRVGLLGKEIARYTHRDPHALFLPGLVHDVGKAVIDSKVLQKTVGFDGEDKRQMDEHPIFGYKLLEGVAPFSALVSYFHHYFGKNGYPKGNQLPPVNVPFQEDTLHLARECARLVSIADFWDAITHRENDKYSSGQPRLPTREEAFDILLKNSGSRTYEVKELYKGGILS